MSIRRSAIITAGILLVLGLVALLSSTFAWLDVSRVPFVSDLEVSVITENRLLIAPDEDGQPGEWNTFFDASGYFQDMAPLYPVTYVDGWFSKLVYDKTGRADYVTPITEDNINVMIDNAIGISADGSAEITGYVLAIDCWMKTEGGSATVFLSDPVETSDGQMGGGTYAVGSPIWSDETATHSNGGYGSETTLRLGFQFQHTDMNRNATSEKSFFIYEPNADIHPDEALTGYIQTDSVNGGALTDSAHHIIQNASVWNEANPVLADVVVYTPGKFVQNPDLFTIRSGEMIKTRIFFWMEGQDIDCIARNVTDAVSIAANIQFGVKDANDDRDVEIVRK